MFHKKILTLYSSQIDKQKLQDKIYSSSYVVVKSWVAQKITRHQLLSHKKSGALYGSAQI